MVANSLGQIEIVLGESSTGLLFELFECCGILVCEFWAGCTIGAVHAVYVARDWSVCRGGRVFYEEKFKIGIERVRFCW